ncbi:MAG: glycerol acyltransferase [Chloroflexi bacterium]|nr:glycerol acyltransferase [Chloroflexota bacterium]
MGDRAKVNLDGLQTLTEINLDDLVSSFGWQRQPFLARALRRIFHQPAQTFAKIMLEFDSAIGERGLVEAARRTQKRFVRDVRVFGLDRLPDSPFLALSNHPGMTDTLALFAALNRPDLKIIALDRPFLMALPNMSRQLFFVHDDPAARMKLVRQVSGHLRGGGSALTFPAGEIEPDPDVYPGAVDSLQKWTDSVGVFVRMAPETVILPALVRNVIWEKTAKLPLLKIKKTRAEREKLAAALQLLAMVMWDAKPVTVTVQIGNAVDPKKLGANTQVIHQAALDEMKSLIENPPQGEGVSVL